MAATMLATVSPVIRGAADASPHPTKPSSVSMRTKMFSTVLISAPPVFIGRRSGSDAIMDLMCLIFMITSPLSSLGRDLAWLPIFFRDFQVEQPCRVEAEDVALGLIVKERQIEQ